LSSAMKVNYVKSSLQTKQKVFVLAPSGNCTPNSTSGRGNSE